MTAQQQETIMVSAFEIGKAQLIEEIMSYTILDFTLEYLRKQAIDKLRHIWAAAKIKLSNQ